MSNKRIITKQLAGINDLTLGIGKVSQSRGGSNVEITKVNVTELQGALVVTSIEDMIALVIADLGDTKTVIVNDVGIFVYDSTKSDVNNELTIFDGWVLLTELNVSTIDELIDITSYDEGRVCTVSDLDRGGIFVYDSTKVDDDNQGTNFNGWVRQYDGAINIKWFGAKGDGITDDTEAIQKAINNHENIYIPDGVFLVSKNTTINYTDNDEPCIMINGKDNFTIGGVGAIKVETHGQGIIDIIDSENVYISGITLNGLGIFPALDGTTGRGEKGNPDAGYDTTQYSSMYGKYRNNQLDTSAFTGVNGDTNATFGTFNGGYIGNLGSGITLLNSSNVTIENITVSGFNGNGILVGFKSSEEAKAKRADNIIITKCKIFSNYNAGIEIDYANNVVTDKCYIHTNGHYNSSITDDNANPGYGQSTSLSWGIVTNIKVTNSTFESNVRKGIDAHGVTNYFVNNNRVKDSAQGIHIEVFGGDAEKCIITNNNLLRCGTHDLSAIYYSAPIDVAELPYSGLNISNNILEDCGSSSGMIFVRKTRGAQILGNHIVGTHLDNPNSAIYLGRTTESSYDVICNNNSIRADVTYGITINNIKSVVCSGNLLYSELSTASKGVRLTEGPERTFIDGNIATGTFDEIINNLPDVGKNIDVTRVKEGRDVKIASILIDGDNKVLTKLNDHADIVDSIVSASSGFTINYSRALKELPFILWSYVELSVFDDGTNTASWVTVRSESTSSFKIGLQDTEGSATYISWDDITSGKMKISIFFAD